MSEEPLKLPPQLVFETDGTLSADQLAALPEEFRERVTTPEFQEMVRREIAKARGRKTGRRETRIATQGSVRTPPRTIRTTPPGVSRREFREVGRAAKRLMKRGIR